TLFRSRVKSLIFPANSPDPLIITLVAVHAGTASEQMVERVTQANAATRARVRCTLTAGIKVTEQADQDGCARGREVREIDLEGESVAVAASVNLAELITDICLTHQLRSDFTANANVKVVVVGIGNVIGRSKNRRIDADQVAAPAIIGVPETVPDTHIDLRTQCIVEINGNRIGVTIDEERRL